MVSSPHSKLDAPAQTGLRPSSGTPQTEEPGRSELLREGIDRMAAVLTALERSSPAEPGYGEIQHRQSVMAEGKAWLLRARKETFDD